MIKITSERITLHKPFLFFIAIFSSVFCFSQVYPAKNYPQGYFIYPVDARISLSANFGELRSNHYHMGLDCRTNQVENRRVSAAADGYISRISVASFGFGRAIYITHPNGFTTLYGHLNQFFPALEEYLEEKQYEQESWNVSLNLTPEQFPVKEGQFIALSGNTGGSAGPHVHFEIRETKSDKVLNPLLFDLPIPDKVPPTLVHLYLYDRCFSTYSKAPVHLPIKKTGEKYTTVQSIIPVNTDKISFGITANDKQSGSANPNGIYQAVIYLDGLPLSGFRLDSIDYNETRYLNAHIDYKKRAEGGPYVQHLSRLPGYPEGVYTDFNGDGVINLEDDQEHLVRIEVSDPDANMSVLEFKIRKGMIQEKKADTQHDLFRDRVEFHPGFVNVFENENLHVHLSPAALYDSVTFRYANKKSVNTDSYSDVYSVLSGEIPVQDFFTIKIKPSVPVPDSLAAKIVMKRTWKGSSEIIPAKREGQWYVGKFRNFGDFELLADTKQPVIGGFANNANLSKSSRIVFSPSDNSDIASFRAELDGKWLRFTNDKGRNYIYIFDKKCPPGKHTLKITVADIAGNISERTIDFTR